MSNLWDCAFLYEPEFESLRSECKPVGIGGDFRVDFIFRHNNDSNNATDWIFGEEKPASASKGEVLNDTRKCESMRELTLELWQNQCGQQKRALLEKYLEAVSVQWRGTYGTIYGTKVIFVPRNQATLPVYIHYHKATINIMGSGHPQKFEFLAKCIQTVLAVKRDTILRQKQYMLLANTACADGDTALSDLEEKLADETKTFQEMYC
ncbi:hypothetical protein DFQ28_003239 [Apophysomyces sp. BC1034]|nr:hypothetical protein DFQ30_004755 [Apophysomyces sp. BC1015]KAG0179596.1 hypothetical protein DFQ29_001882 [Apophysomyces sp. BC1021]KAG0189594.1 hypothetical protein DFQ28_003239 [Apophysomyces sp. BC1034]